MWKKIGGIFLFGSMFFAQAKADLVYPIQTMSKPSCRFQDYSTLGDDCKQPLPILNTKDYTKYKNDYNTYRRVYTVLWGSSYTYGWDVGNGGHSGVDIATAKGTPVYSMTQGKVVYAGNVAGRGNVVRIQHEVNGRTIYSGYAHMSKIDVKVGDTVNSSQKVGEVGSTGNSTGNHLHFQIDLVKANTLWYRKLCTVKDYTTIINGGKCFAELNQNTIDPLLYLETGGAVVKATTVEKPKQETISKEGLISNEEILKREINEFLGLYDVKIDVQNYGSNVLFGNKVNVRISVNDKRTGCPFNGSFPGDMAFKYDTKKMSIFPAGILLIENGFRDFVITPKTTGVLDFEVFIGQISIKKLKFGVFDSKGATPYEAQVNVDGDVTLGEIKKVSLSFKTKEGIDILGVPFIGTYSLTSDNGTLKFCKKGTGSISEYEAIYNINCDEFDFTKGFEFSYKDTIGGKLPFNIKTSAPNKTTLQVKNAKGTIIGYMALNPTNPLNLTSTHPYYTEILELGKIGAFPGSKQGYYNQDRELYFRDALVMLRNTLAYLKTKCKSGDTNCNTEFNKKIEALKKLNLKKYDSLTLSRIQFIKMVKLFVPMKNTSDKKVVYRDLVPQEQILVDSVLADALWKDQFGASRYFQPTKIITKAEASYVIYSLFK